MVGIQSMAVVDIYYHLMSHAPFPQWKTALAVSVRCETPRERHRSQFGSNAWRSEWWRGFSSSSHSLTTGCRIIHKGRKSNIHWASTMCPTLEQSLLYKTVHLILITILEANPRIPIFKVRNMFSKRSRNVHKVSQKFGSRARIWTHICLIPNSTFFL